MEKSPIPGDSNIIWQVTPEDNQVIMVMSLSEIGSLTVTTLVYTCGNAYME
jgi:hypothetical protein